MKKILFFFLCAVIGRAMAADDFARLDTNHDGYLDTAEAAAMPALEDAFAVLDRDRDGRLSPAEYAAAMPGPQGAPAAAADQPKR